MVASCHHPSENFFQPFHSFRTLLWKFANCSLETDLLVRKSLRFLLHFWRIILPNTKFYFFFFLGTSLFFLLAYFLKRSHVVQLVSHVQLFVTPWTEACQASLPFTMSRSLLKFMSIESVMLSNHLILCCLLLLPSTFPSIRVFSQWVGSSNQVAKESIRASASSSVLPVNSQSWFPLGLTGLILVPVQGTRKSFFQHHRLKASIMLSAEPSLWSNSRILHNYWKNHSFVCTDLCLQHDFFAFVFPVVIYGASPFARTRLWYIKGREIIDFPFLLQTVIMKLYMKQWIVYS